MKKRIYTSYYSKPKRNLHEGSVYAISRKPPEWYDGEHLPALAPSWDMVMDSKNDIISQSEYTKLYLNYLNENLDPTELADMLPDNCMLLCYERSDDFCHRHILAKWLNDNADIEAVEWKEPPTAQELFLDDVLTF